MFRKQLALIVILLVSLAVAMPASADVPHMGTVYEGDSVPGIVLGYSRAQVEGAYGQPYYCQSYSIPDDFAYCTYPTIEGSLVSVRYEGADGGFAHNSADDRSFWIGWGETLGGWTTTAGVNTTLAKDDPDAVIAAYPDAEVTYLNSGLIESVVDWLQGVEIRWSYDPYTGATHVSMSIFEPLSALPTTQETHVQKIELSAYKDRGIRKVNGWVEILDEHGRAAMGATVYASWQLPDGSIQYTVDDFTGAGGVAFFQLFAPMGKSYRGDYTLRIENVIYADHAFNPADSILSDSIYIK